MQGDAVVRDIINLVLYPLFGIWYPNPQDSDWHEASVWRPVRLQDGSFASGVLMRAWRGRWIYRRPTPAELQERDDRMVW